MVRTAKTISILGHPIVIGIIYVIFISFRKLPSETATWISGLMICIVAIPIVLHNWYKIKKGAYTNFDVSDQKQRRGFYPFAIGLFSAVLVLFYILDLPSEVIWSTSVFLFLLLLMATLNYKLKASLHVAIAFYITVNLFDSGFLLGLLMLVFSIMISWSRWHMKRHSLLEIGIGSLVGCLFGLLGLWVVK